MLAESVHGDRAVRRWGVPIQTADEAIAFVGLDGEQHVLPATSTVGPFGPELIFEPGGIRYLQVRRLAVPLGAGSVSWAVAERSMTATGTRIVYQQELPTPGRIPSTPSV